MSTQARLVASLLFASTAFATIASHALAATSVAVTPTVVNLGTLQNSSRPDEGQSHVGAEITLTNTGTSDVSFGYTLPNFAYPAFVCAVAGDPTLRFVIHPGESCLFQPDIMPWQLIGPGVYGPETSALNIVVNGGQLVLPVTLNWTAIPLLLAVDTTVVAFGDVPVNTAATITVFREVRNNTSSPIDIDVEAAFGGAPDCSGRFATPLCLDETRQVQESFSVDDTGCHPIPAMTSCQISISFLPKAPFRMEGNVQVSGPPGSAVVAQSIAVSGMGAPPRTNTETILAVEYVNLVLGHYFITADDLEKSLLENGHFAGWTRTGRSFWVLPAGSGGSSPVCRFYGRPEAGLDSHFYSASPDECAAVLERFSSAWMLESNDVFNVHLPDPATGTCPPGTNVVFRVYNGKPDANHRYTTRLDVRASMIAAGWIAEGYGPNGVAMCVPQ
jgi:hypothetical protein